MYFPIWIRHLIPDLTTFWFLYEIRFLNVTWHLWDINLGFPSNRFNFSHWRIKHSLFFSGVCLPVSLIIRLQKLFHRYFLLPYCICLITLSQLEWVSWEQFQGCKLWMRLVSRGVFLGQNLKSRKLSMFFWTKVDVRVAICLNYRQ